MNHALVETPRLCAATTATIRAMTAAKQSASTRKVITPSILPASSTARRGWRTSSWRSVPRLYSLATCEAAMPNATTPSSIAARATPMTRPFGWASWCSVTIPPCRRGLREHQDHEQRGRYGQPEEGRQEQRRPPQLGPLTGKGCPGHRIAPISWPSGTSADCRAGQREERPLQAAGALGELTQGDPVLRGEPVQCPPRPSPDCLRTDQRARGVCSASPHSRPAVSRRGQQVAVRVVFRRDHELRLLGGSQSATLLPGGPAGPP